VIRQPLRNRWRDAQSLMDTAEIEMRDKEPDRRQMVVGTLAEPVRESREAARRHAKREVLAFGVAGRNVARRADDGALAYRHLHDLANTDAPRPLLSRRHRI
jgi:hypothetical protein